MRENVRRLEISTATPPLREAVLSVAEVAELLRSNRDELAYRD